MSVHPIGRSPSLKAALIACMVPAFVLLVSLSISAKPPSGKGGGGGGGSISPPAYVYVLSDSVITTASETGTVLSKLTAKSRTVLRRSPNWSPDGQWIIYIEHPDVKNQPQIADLYVMAQDGSAKTRIHRFDGSANNGGWSRYSRIEWFAADYAAYTTNSGTEVIDLVTGSRQNLGSFSSPSIGFGVDPSIPGSQGLLVYAGTGQENGDADTDIHLAIVRAENDQTLTVDPATIRSLSLPGNQHWAALSPDERQIAFYDNASGDGGRVIMTVDLDYSNGVNFRAETVRTLLVGGLGEFRVFPSWSADSQWIAFTWFDPNQTASEIARIRWDGSVFENVTDSGTHEVYPSCFPVASAADGL